MHGPLHSIAKVRVSPTCSSSILLYCCSAFFFNRDFLWAFVFLNYFLRNEFPQLVHCGKDMTKITGDLRKFTVGHGGEQLEHYLWQ